MIRRLTIAALLLLASAGASSQQQALLPAAEQTDHRILVMLHLPPEHYRPAGDYGAGGYGDRAAEAARRRLAGRLARDQGLTLADNWPMPLLGVDCVVMIVPDGKSVEAAAEQMSHKPGVDWSQPMHLFETQSAAPGSLNDRLFQAQPAAHEWKLADLHKMATGQGVKVAVIDSQIEVAHPDLRGQVIANRDFVGGQVPAGEAHGTGIAGIIAAHANNGLGIAGVAPSAQLLGLRACWQRAGDSPATVCDSLSLAKALTYAVEHHADVINLSLTGPNDLLLTRLVEAGLERGSAVVAAIDPRTGAGFPASVPGVIAVAEEGLAAGRRGVYNAPGRDVPTTEPGGRWYLVSGNSYAAAHVSGLLALMRQLHPERSYGRLLISSQDGGGLIDACRTLARMARQGGSSCQTG